jgi:hypothetical protein
MGTSTVNIASGPMTSATSAPPVAATARLQCSHPEFRAVIHDASHTPRERDLQKSHPQNHCVGTLTYLDPTPTNVKIQQSVVARSPLWAPPGNLLGFTIDRPLLRMICRQINDIRGCSLHWTQCSMPSIRLRSCAQTSLDLRWDRKWDRSAVERHVLLRERETSRLCHD